MTTSQMIEKLISTETADIGYTESPANSNMTKYGKEYGINGVKWCVIAQYIWFKHSGLSQYFYGGGKTASCSELVTYHKNKGQVITSGYKRGDLILFNFSGGSNPQHIGLCTEYDGRTVTTIDGNTGTTSEANGGAVMLRKRTLDSKTKIVCGIRWYNSVVSNKTVSVTIPYLEIGISNNSVGVLQTILNQKGFDCGAVDCAYGNKTAEAVKKYQASKGLTSDGVCGQNTWNSILNK